MQVQGIVGNIKSINHGDSGLPVATLGKQGEQLIGAAHGDLFNMAVRGALFHGSTAPAGVTIPVSSTTAPTFTLWNPAASGVNVEVLEMIIAMANATMVVTPLLLGLITAAPTSVTPITATIMAGKVGAASPAAALYSAATIVAATNFFLLSGFSATSGALQAFGLDLRGGLILPPGTGVHLCGTAALTQAAACRASWAEWAI